MEFKELQDICLLLLTKGTSIVLNSLRSALPLGSSKNSMSPCILKINRRINI